MPLDFNLEKGMKAKDKIKHKAVLDDLLDMAQDFLVLVRAVQAEPDQPDHMVGALLHTEKHLMAIHRTCRISRALLEES